MAWSGLSRMASRYSAMASSSLALRLQGSPRLGMGQTLLRGRTARAARSGAAPPPPAADNVLRPRGPCRRTEWPRIVVDPEVVRAANARRGGGPRPPPRGRRPHLSRSGQQPEALGGLGARAASSAGQLAEGGQGLGARRPRPARRASRQGSGSAARAAATSRRPRLLGGPGSCAGLGPVVEERGQLRRVRSRGDPGAGLLGSVASRSRPALRKAAA